VDQHGPADEAPSDPRRTRRRWALAATVGSLAAFALFTWSAVAETGLARVDPGVQDFVVRHRVDWLTDTFRILTHLGSSVILVVVLAAFGVLVWISRRSLVALTLPIVAFVVTVLAKNAAKALIERPRPSPALAIGSNTGFAFPSGHAADSLAVFAMLALILSTARTPRAKWALWSCALAVVMVVGASRVYLGSHWLSDVLGGWALAAAIVSLLAWMFPPWDRARPPARPTLKPPEGPART
jgi:membrane-associated phospholipid phosphatase